MDALTRRKFLIASGVAGAGAIAVGTATLGFVELLRKGSKAAPGERRPALVLVTLYGGNDGLNTFIPYADPAYYRARPELAYPAQTVLHLDSAMGLNPMLPGLKRLWDEKRLAIVQGVGYPKPDRSHFRSMDIWQSASPAGPVTTGWIGRWLDGTKAPVEAAVSFEPVLPPLLVGKSRVGACISWGGLELPPWVDTGLIEALGKAEPGEPAMQAIAAAAYTDLLVMARTVREAGKATASPGADHEPELPATATGGQNALTAQLALVARCVESGVPTKVYSVSLGGFDTHAAERAGHEILLRQLDEALTGFVERMASTEAGQQVVVAVYSEFGRRVRANASDGTDHGTAGPIFVMGPRVAGGLYGEQPSLADLDDGDLKATTDFRDVFGTLLSSVLQADPGQYLTGYKATQMPFIPPA